MYTVHPTAIVAEEAELAEGVEVGPGCVVEGRVKVGTGSRLLHRVSLSGPMTLGRRTTIYPNAHLGGPAFGHDVHEPSDRSSDPGAGGGGGGGIVFGDGNVIREGVCIDAPVSGGPPTMLGDDNYLMVNCHLGPGVRLGDGCTLVNGVVIGARAELGDGVILGGHAVVAEGRRMGRLSMLSGLCDLTRDLPPYCVVYNARRVGGLNLVGLRRAGLREHIAPLRRAFNLLYRQGLEIDEALGRIDAELGHDPLCAELVAFVRDSSHGITPYERGAAGVL